MTSHTYMHTHTGYVSIALQPLAAGYPAAAAATRFAIPAVAAATYAGQVPYVRHTHTRAPVVAATSTYNVKTSHKNARAAEASPQGNIDQMLLYLTANQRSCPLAPLAPPTSDITLNFGFSGGGKNLRFKKLQFAFVSHSIYKYTTCSNYAWPWQQNCTYMCVTSQQAIPASLIGVWAQSMCLRVTTVAPMIVCRHSYATQSLQPYVTVPYQLLLLAANVGHKRGLIQSSPWLRSAFNCVVSLHYLSKCSPHVRTHIPLHWSMGLVKSVHVNANLSSSPSV